MKNSKLVKLIRALDYRERKRLRKFVVSPFFNENEDLARLLYLLVQELPESRAAMWGELFPQERYDDLRLRHLMSDLMRLVEAFLAITEVQRKPAMMQVHLLGALRKKEVSDLYAFIQRKYERKRSKAMLGSDLFLERYLLQAEHNSWLESVANRTGITNTQQAVNELDIFYLFNKLKYSCTVLNNQKVMGLAYENVLLDEIIQHLAQKSYADQPGVALYYQVYKMLVEPENSSHYQELKALLAAHSMKFEPAEARDMYALAQNHCIGKINQGESAFLREIFGLYQEGLERKILLDKGRISPWDYKNIVVVGLRLEEFAWVENFIHVYRENIAEEFRDNAYTFNLARFHFYQRSYGEVLKLLQQVEYEDVFYNLDSKVMLLKIYFELDEFEALDSLIDSFRIFLRRNKLISDHHRTNYLNLINFVKKLSRLGAGDRTGLRRIEEEVSATQQLADANWLRRKLAELRGG